MPQFDPSTMSPQIVWLIISFAVFYFLMARLALPKIGEVLEERSEHIADDLDQAESVKREADQVRDNFQETLGEARSTAAKTIQAARDDMQKKVDARLHALDEQLAAHAQASEAKITAEKQAAMAALQSVSVEACQEIVSKLVGGSVPTGDIEAAVKAQIESQGNA